MKTVQFLHVLQISEEIIASVERLRLLDKAKFVFCTRKNERKKKFNNNNSDFATPSWHAYL